MQLLNRENLKFEILPESLDDLWVLSSFIVPEDIICGKAERKIKIGTGDNYKVTRKLIYVELEVTSAKFENDTLRVQGKILNENEFAPIGSVQSLSYNITDKIEIKKRALLNYEEKILENSIKSKKSTNLLIVLDKDELLATEFSSVNFSVLFKEEGLGSKKYTQEQIDENEQKYKLIIDLLNKDYANLILAGPGFFKEDFAKYLKDKTKIKISTFMWHDVSSQSVQNLIKKINESGVIQDSSIARESEYTTKLLENINKNQKSVYGYEKTIEKINEGSVEAFLITTKIIEEKKEEGAYKELNDLMMLVEQLKGELVIINSKNESGKIIDGLGGVAGILRY